MLNVSLTSVTCIWLACRPVSPANHCCLCFLDIITCGIAACYSVDLTTLFCGVTRIIHAVEGVVPCTVTQSGAAVPKDDLSRLTHIRQGTKSAFSLIYTWNWSLSSNVIISSPLSSWHLDSVHKSIIIYTQSAQPRGSHIVSRWAKLMWAMSGGNLVFANAKRSTQWLSTRCWKWKHFLSFRLLFPLMAQQMSPFHLLPVAIKYISIQGNMFCLHLPTDC